MKRLITICLLALLISITSCKSQEKILKEDIYGKYDFVECLYVNQNNTFTIEQINNLFKSQARYSLKETSFAFYENSSTTPTISIKNIEYKDVEVNNSITDNAVKKILKNTSTRFDIYRNDISQGYSFVFGEDEVYYLEFRSTSNNNHTVWHVFRLEKRD